MRKCIIAEPLFDRANTGDNTPAVIHVDLVEGDGFEIIAVAFDAAGKAAVEAKIRADDIAERPDMVILAPVDATGCVVVVGRGSTMSSATLGPKNASNGRNINVIEMNPSWNICRLATRWKLTFSVEPRRIGERGPESTIRLSSANSSMNCAIGSYRS